MVGGFKEFLIEEFQLNLFLKLLGYAALVFFPLYLGISCWIILKKR